jgi:hypothetical protein
MANSPPCVGSSATNGTSSIPEREVARLARQGRIRALKTHLGPDEVAARQQQGGMPRTQRARSSTVVPEVVRVAARAVRPPHRARLSDIPTRVMPSYVAPVECGRGRRLLRPRSQ